MIQRREIEILFGGLGRGGLNRGGRRGGEKVPER